MHRSETPGRQPIHQAGDGAPEGPPRRRRTGPVVKGRHHPPRRDGL